MKENKFCFIICTNRERYYQESEFYISHIRIPEGYEAEIMPVRDVSGMAAGYNSAMSATDARYKIYLHQDVFILYPHFLEDLLTIFSSDERIAMIGMEGAIRTSPDAVFWNAPRAGGIYEGKEDLAGFASYRYDLRDGLTDCEYVDGMLIATNRDLSWREDLFSDWCFYDAAQGYEFRKRGWRVVVPTQKLPWCAHEESAVNLWSYDKYRRIFMKEYMSEP